MSTGRALPSSDTQLRAFIDGVPAMAWCALPDGSPEFLNQQCHTYTGLSPEELARSGWESAVHPEDVERMWNWWRNLLQNGEPGELEARFRRFDGAYRWFLIRVVPVRDERGDIIHWYGSNTDIEDRKRAEERLRQSEKELCTITDAIRQAIVVLAPDGTTLYANRVAREQIDLTIEEVKGAGFLSQGFHPDDLGRVQAERRAGLSHGVPFELELRARQKDGEYRWSLIQYNPLRDEQNQLVRWYATATDIDDLKRTEQHLRRAEQEFRAITDAIPQYIVVLTPDGNVIYTNRVVFERTGLTVADVGEEGSFWLPFHPDDVERVRAERREGLFQDKPFEIEVRVLLTTGQYRWHLIQYNPQKDEYGRTIRWYATGTDIDNRKKAEESLRKENVALREEIDRSSMFEDIVGSCEPIRQVLKQVAKVAPSESTVLILGETGTGKELIARALHRRSNRAARAFVSVNCAAIPQSLIMSELFGHEKGAFTGALQRRLGKFESADGGTLFLDEVGELSMETQIALLRVLQEREIERLGSNRPVSIDVRLIAATNRNLPLAVAAGTFREDLFYRLNVVPITVPPLRDRVDDIPALVEYFVGRYAKRAGKHIRHIGKQTLAQLRAYRWPGNIRELQNVVERATILSEGETFTVDESWLKHDSNDALTPDKGVSALAAREIEMIEAALAESHGRISGPSGAAAKLGIPRQTLESKISRLGIDKHGRKS